MKVSKAITKLLTLQQLSPKADVTIKVVKSKKKKSKKKKLGVTERLKIWAKKRCEDGKTFSFLQACRMYQRIGGSAGTTTVLHRLGDIGARNVSPKLAESHLDSRWTIYPTAKTADEVVALIDADPTFKDRYNAERRRMIARGLLAPKPFEEVTFSKSFGKKREFWVSSNDPDPDRQIRIRVKPVVVETPTTN